MQSSGNAHALQLVSEAMAFRSYKGPEKTEFTFLILQLRKQDTQQELAAQGHRASFYWK